MYVAFSTDSPLGKGIELYTGRVLVALDVYQDPVLTNVFAVRATTLASSPRKRSVLVDRVDYFLLKGVPLLQFPIRAKTIEEELEEVEFTEWPPKAVR